MPPPPPANATVAIWKFRALAVAIVAICFTALIGEAAADLAPGPYPGPSPVAHGRCANLYVDEDTGAFIPGSRLGDRILGRKGGDLIRARRGRDCVFGGDGADDLRGDRGADLIRGGAGDDILVGGAGDDSIYGGRGDDALYARDQRGETIRCGSGFDSVYTADEDDKLRDCEGRPGDFETIPSPPVYAKAEGRERATGGSGCAVTPRPKWCVKPSLPRGPVSS